MRGWRQLHNPSRQGGERIFNAFAKSGKEKVAFSEAFWGGYFGIVDDQFGNEWMISAQ